MRKCIPEEGKVGVDYRRQMPDKTCGEATLHVPARRKIKPVARSRCTAAKDNARWEPAWKWNLVLAWQKIKLQNHEINPLVAADFLGYLRFIWKRLEPSKPKNRIFPRWSISMILQVLNHRKSQHQLRWMNIIYTIEAISFFCILLALVILMVEQGNFHF